jgi:hypothetical protein
LPRCLSRKENQPLLSGKSSASSRRKVLDFFLAVTPHPLFARELRAVLRIRSPPLPHAVALVKSLLLVQRQGVVLPRVMTGALVLAPAPLLDALLHPLLDTSLVNVEQLSSLSSTSPTMMLPASIRLSPPRTHRHSFLLLAVYLLPSKFLLEIHRSFALMFSEACSNLRATRHLRLQLLRSSVNLAPFGSRFAVMLSTCLSLSANTA